MTRTLFILPNAIGDVICGLDVASLLATDGELCWIVNDRSAPVLEGLPYATLHPPAVRVRRMAACGAPTELLWRETDMFLNQVRSAGPFDRIVNVHLSRAASIIAGAAMKNATDAMGRAEYSCGIDRRGPALTNRVWSDPWSDFFISSIHFGFAPEISAPSRFRLVAGLPSVEVLLTKDRSKSIASGNAPGGGLVIFCPAAGWPSKALNVAQAAAIADRLRVIGPVELLAGPEDRAFLDAIRNAQRERPASVRTGHLTSALAAVHDARLIVTADSWPLHAASAAHRPVLALLGPTRVFPRGKAAALAPDAPVSWSPDNDRSIDGISADAVFAASLALLEGGKPASSNGLQNMIWWDCRGAWPVPSRQGVGCDDAAAIFNWARAVGYNAVVRRFRSDLPQAVLRPASELALVYASLNTAIHQARARLQADSDSAFALFPTTFPDEDPSCVIAFWRDATAQALEGLA